MRRIEIEKDRFQEQYQQQQQKLDELNNKNQLMNAQVASLWVEVDRESDLLKEAQS